MTDSQCIALIAAILMTGDILGRENAVRVRADADYVARAQRLFQRVTAPPRKPEVMADLAVAEDGIAWDGDDT